MEAHLHEESYKCQKLENEVKVLHQKAEKRSRIVARLKSGLSERTRKVQNHGYNIVDNSSTTGKSNLPVIYKGLSVSVRKMALSLVLLK